MAQCGGHEIEIVDKGLTIDGKIYGWNQVCLEVPPNPGFADPTGDFSKSIVKILHYPGGKLRYSDCDPNLVAAIDLEIHNC